MAIYLKKDLPIKNELPEINFVSNLAQEKLVLKIGILNLMPNLERTEYQLIKALDNPKITLELDFIYLDSKKTNPDKVAYYQKYYSSFSSIKNTKYDGMIITGAPLEHIPYASITYIHELKSFFNYTKTNVKSTLFLCWAAEYGLQYFYGVNRYYLQTKASGLYKHYTVSKSLITKGLENSYYIPISRYCSLMENEIINNKSLILTSKSDLTGPYIIEAVDGSKVFLTGHAEYEKNTLKEEYERDIKKGLAVNVPANYFPNDDATQEPSYIWHHAKMTIYHNWIYYYVYSSNRNTDML